MFSKKKKENEEETQQVSEEETQQENAPPPSRLLPILDFVMRIIAMISTLGSAIAMGTTSTTSNGNPLIPDFTRLVRLKGEYRAFPTFKFFVVSNALTSAYLAVSLLLSIFHILKTGAKLTRAVLIILDMIVLALLTAGASAAASIVYLAHNGNVEANWSSICEQYNSLCDRGSGSLVGSFIGALLIILLISLSAVALSRQ